MQTFGAQISKGAKTLEWQLPEKCSSLKPRQVQKESPLWNTLEKNHGYLEGNQLLLKPRRPHQRFLTGSCAPERQEESPAAAGAISAPITRCAGQPALLRGEGKAIYTARLSGFYLDNYQREYAVSPAQGAHLRARR